MFQKPGRQLGHTRCNRTIIFVSLIQPHLQAECAKGCYHYRTQGTLSGDRFQDPRSRDRTALLLFQGIPALSRASEVANWEAGTFSSMEHVIEHFKRTSTHLVRADPNYFSRLRQLSQRTVCLISTSAHPQSRNISTSHTPNMPSAGRRPVKLCNAIHQPVLVCRVPPQQPKCIHSLPRQGK
jgi:hypothetical protein